MLSDDFPLDEGTFVHYRDSLYEHYFKQDFTSHDDFLHQAAVCYAEVVNYHQRMNYAMGEKEYNDQVWFMAEWIRQHKKWPILQGMTQDALASSIGTFIFQGLDNKGANQLDELERKKRVCERRAWYIKTFGKPVGEILGAILGAFLGAL